MLITHVAPEPGAVGVQLVLHVQQLPRTARDWEEACVDLGRVLLPMLAGAPFTAVLDRAVPGRSDRLRVGPLPQPSAEALIGIGGRGEAGSLPRRVVRLSVAASQDDVHGLPARLEVAPADEVADGSPALHELLAPVWWCVVEPASGAPGATAAGHTPEAWAVLARSRVVRERLSVAADPAAPPDLLLALASDASAGVRRAVAGNPGAPEATLARLVTDPQRRVREALVVNPSLTPALLVRLQHDAAWQVRWSVLDNPALDDEVLRDAAASDDAVVRRLLAARPHLPADVRATLLTDGDHEVRAHLAAFTADPATLAALVVDPDARVRARAAENELLTGDQLSALVRDRSAQVRDAMAWRHDLPLEHRERLARDPAQRVRSALAHNRQPPSVLAILRADPDEEVRGAAENGDNTR